jgi:glycine cleavage system transcriptional repressor
MQTSFVLTLTGPDRIGIVERLTGLVLARGGNIEASRMSRLGGDFAVLMLVSMPAEHSTALDADLDTLRAEGFVLSSSPARPDPETDFSDWVPRRVEVRGADHEGIIHEVSSYLSRHGISIESADSETEPAPTTGSPLFSMTAHIAVPPELVDEQWLPGLTALADEQNLEIEIDAEV